MTKSSRIIEIENINTPGQFNRVDEDKYIDVKNAMLQILPDQSPGLTHKEIPEAMLNRLSESLFPGGAKRGWWSKTVQLDLEAKKLITREDTKPLRWHKAAQQKT